MKLITFFLIVGLMQVSASVYSQYLKVEFPQTSISVKDVMMTIEKNSDYKFLYRNDQMDVNRMVEIASHSYSLDNILSQVLNKTNLSYQILENNLVVITPEQKKNIVKGVVKDLQGNTLPGVTIIVKGTKKIGITDIKGNYAIQINENDKILVFSFIGMKKQEILIGGQPVINVIMESETSTLDEVVVIGYGSVKKSDLTGSVSSVRSKDFGNTSVSNVGQLLVGKVAGVDMARSSGNVDAGVSIKVRGTTSLNNVSPLWVVDGMISDADMVNINDIASIELLKDASSTAIYGSKGANGVFLVTTKKGKAGKVKVDYNGYYGAASPNKKLDFLNASQYTDLLYEINGGKYNAQTGQFTAPAGLPAKMYDQQYMRTDRTNWQDELLRPVNVQEHHIAVHGGNDFSIFRVSADYLKQGQIGGNKDYNRYMLSVNSEHKIGKYVKVGESIDIRQKKVTGNDPDFYWSIRMPTNVPIFHPSDGNTDNYSNINTSEDMNDSHNAVKAMNLPKTEYEEMKYMIQLWGEVQFLRDFTFRSQFKYDRNSDHNFSYSKGSIDGNMPSSDYLNESYSYGTYPLWENYLTYKKKLGIHDITLMAGNSYNNLDFNRNLGISSTGYSSFDILLPSFAKTSTISTNGIYHSSHMAYYGRANYQLLDKYLVTLSMRADASDRFAPANRWGYFPSAALGWKVSSESFMKSIDAISNLKLRGSYGKSGNDGIGQYLYYSNVWYGAQNNVEYPFGDQGTLSQLQRGATISSLASQNIRWETTTTTDIGIDLGLFKNKLSITADFYNKLTNDILINIPVPQSTGIDNASTQNAAKLSNKGFDFNVTYVNHLGDFTYSVTVVGGYNKNKVVSLGDGQPINDGVARTEAGSPIGYFWGYKTDGVVSTQAEANIYNSKYPNIHVNPGDFRFVDTNGDGKITDDDRVNLGNGQPAWTYGGNISLAYKGFDFAASLQGIYGNQIYNTFVRSYLNAGNRPFNGTTELLSRWKQEGDVTNIPRAYSGNSQNLLPSSYFVEDGSYLRIQSITLGYTFPQRLINKIFFNGVERMRFYISSENPLTLTKFSGYLPDDNNSSITGRGQSGGGVIPLPRTILGGIQVSF